MTRDLMLTVYALAVLRMRELQRIYPETEGDLPSAVRRRAEDEVDALTALHLLPSITDLPRVVDGGAP